MYMSSKIVTYTSIVSFGYCSISEIIQHSEKMKKYLKFKVQFMILDLRRRQIKNHIKI
jgi:uncharacterized membrane protein